MTQSRLTQELNVKDKDGDAQFQSRLPLARKWGLTQHSLLADYTVLEISCRGWAQDSACTQYALGTFY